MIGHRLLRGLEGLGFQLEDPVGKLGKGEHFFTKRTGLRGLGEREAPRALLHQAGFDFKPAAEEETCCGFGGTYSGKFPEISSQILKRKLDDFNATGADLLVTECPGCVMQLRGGAERAGHRLAVRHIAEVLCDRMTAEDAARNKE
jgi:Fe-S oxidoreductase